MPHPNRFKSTAALALTLATAASAAAALTIPSAQARPTSAPVTSSVSNIASNIPTPAEKRGYHFWDAYTGADPVETLTDLDVSADAISPANAAGDETVELSFTSTADQHITFQVFDKDGQLIRAVADADILADTDYAYTWDGRDASGAIVSDDVYEMVLEAEAGNESMSVSDVIIVDHSAPKIKATAKRVRLTSSTAGSFDLPVRASEALMLDLAVSGSAGRATAAAAPGAGSSLVSVPIGSSTMLARALGRSGKARVTVRMKAIDAAGNASSYLVNVDLLAPFSSTDTMDDEQQPGDNGGADDDGGATTSNRLTWPLAGPITSRFGPRWGRMHEGIDMGVPTGRKIGSAAPGRVTYAGWMSGYGNTVIVDHGTLNTLYAHQSKIAVRVGQVVRRGQTVGYVGSTGNSTGPHLHFEVRVGSTAKDPLKYLP